MKTRILFGLVACAGAFVAGAEIELRGWTDRGTPFYEPGEPIVFHLQVADGVKMPAGSQVKWWRSGEDGLSEEGSFGAVNGRVYEVRTALDRAGFVRLRAELTGPDGKRLGALAHFEGGAGVRIHTLAGEPEPADFDAFWAEHKRLLAAVPLKVLEKTELSKPGAAAHVYRVKIACAGPRPVTGHLTVPAKPGRYPARIAFDGYSNNSIERAPGGGPADAITMHINAHGYELAQPDDYYKRFYASVAAHGKTYGLAAADYAKPHESYFGGMTFRVMRAVEFLRSLPEWNGKDITASGGSQGGLQTIWAAGLCPGVTVANANVPWCCDIAGAKAGRRQIGWGVDWTPGAEYFDCINIAKRVPKTCRVNITRAGLGDYCCPPSGIAILYNNIPGPKTIRWVQGSDHGFVPKWKDNGSYLAAADATAAEPVCPLPGKWKLDRETSDEFDDVHVDYAKWWDFTPWWRGRSEYVNRSRNVVERNGFLELWVKRIPDAEQEFEDREQGYLPYTCAIVKSRKKVTYGYFEVRAKGNAAEVRNAFWLYDPLSNGIRRPHKKYRAGSHSEEIDIYEFIGKYVDEAKKKPYEISSHVHRFETPYVEGVANAVQTKMPDLGNTLPVDWCPADDYHTYGFLWTKTEMVWYVDGKPFYRRANDHYHTPLHIMIDNEVANWLRAEIKAIDPATLPACHSIDYFRRWVAVE